MNLETHKVNTWDLNTELNNLTARERRDALVLLYFLNEYKEQDLAFKKLKSNWTDMIYKLPETSSDSYNTIKNGRYNIHSRMKKLYNNYMVQLQPKE